MIATRLIDAALAAEPSDVRRSVQLQTADALACLLAGRRTGEGAAIDAFFPSHVAADAAVIRYTEADPIHVPSCLTPSCVTVPVALAEARDGSTYIRAVAAGTSAGLALAEAVGGARALGQGVWPTLLAAPAMAAVTAGVARGLSRDQLADALSLSLAGRSGRGGRPGGWPSGRWLIIGEATQAGLRAVEAAVAGAKGDPAFPGEDWLRAQVGEDLAEPAALAAPDGAAVTRIGLKPFVTARQGATALGAFLSLLDEGIEPTRIEAVEVELPPETLSVVTRAVEPGNRLSRIANLALQIGLGAFRREELVDIARETPIPDAAQELARRVSIRADAALSGPPEGHWPARVRVTAEGRSVERCLMKLHGDAGDPMARSVIEAKQTAWSLAGLDSVFDAGDDETLLAMARKARAGGPPPSGATPRPVGVAQTQ